MLALGVVAGLAGFAGACSGTSQTSDSTAEPALAAITRPTGTDTLALPLDQFIPAAEDAARVQAAYRVRLRQCVADYGLDFAVPTAPGRSPTAGPNARRYGVTDLSGVSVYGYRPPPDQAGRKPSQKPLTAEVKTVLSGKGPSSINGKSVPAGGCVAKAQRDIGGDQGSVDDGLAQRLSREAFFRSSADSRTRAAITRWSACMKTRGFDYAAPDGAVSDPRFSTGPVAGKVEISTAKADVGCKRSTNLVGIWVAVETAHQQRLVLQNQSALAALRQLQESRLKNAAAVIGSAS
jgi:hypothetical protein